MKNLVFSLFICTLFTYSAFANDYEKPAIPEKYQIEFVQATNSALLLAEMQENLQTVLDEVGAIDIHYSHANNLGYYYTVYGKKDGNDKVMYLKITEKEAVSQTYTSINFKSLKAKGIAIRYYCHYGPRFCVLGGTRPVICGIYDPQTRRCANF